MMIKGKGYSYILCVLLCYTVTGCGKKNTVIPSGDVSIEVYVKHHQVPIAYSKVFVKYNTLVFPGTDTNLYDTYKIADLNGYLRFDNLENGNKEFVLFAIGIDPDWDSSHNTKVWGYVPIAITTSPGESKETKVTIPVSE